jgi:hypothetical protein
MLILGALAVWAVLGAAPAQAQIFSWNPFRKSPPPVPPAQRVSQLIVAVRTDTDERKRVAAVEELRNFDTKAFPEIVPVLAEAAEKDTKPAVRAEAVNSLVRIRPVSNIAGQAIEAAAQHDENWRNRMSAQTALVRYRMAGYVAPTPPPPTPPTQNAKTSAPAPKQPTLPAQTGEPPLNDAPPIVYYDQFGKRIAAPKELGPVIPAPTVPAVPTSNPRTQPPPVSMIPSPYAPPAPTFTPPMVPPPIAAPLAIPQLPTPANPPVIAPPVVAPPFVAPPVFAPTLREPEASEPTFRPINSANPTRTPTLPALPTPPVLPSPTVPNTPAAPLTGPSLDFPMPLTPVPPSPTVPAPMPLTPQPAPTGGPAPF